MGVLYEMTIVKCNGVHRDVGRRSIVKKSTLIANWLVSAGHVSQLNDAELITERFFNEEFPQLDFNEWNTNLNIEESELFLAKVNFSSPVQLEILVKELQSL